ncbi:MAG: UDP-3-O-(3-hydroxymyristoyl)glucosamine N-acyltransferase [Puniceicoccales bacterium]|jgi:UDP-3-O-[3-hydroxymyristoyl] glucosamine N-acyltransferase|nr:UDP-3-O-(3-hydroxymyristoyl)glucosamine N-acyltransferase [Puniceicoccales bacterium]
MFTIHYTLDRIVELVNPSKIQGKLDIDVFTGIASLPKAKTGDISFLGNQKYKAEVFGSKASLILVPESYVGSPRPGQALLMVENPSKALDAICRDIELQCKKPMPTGMHATAIVDPSAKISPKAYVGPLCIVGPNAIIEEDVCLQAHVIIGEEVLIKRGTFVRPHCAILDGTEIGCNCFIDAGVVLGSEGYGYETENGCHKRSPQLGRVVLEDAVDVGANTTIDRARFHETRIGEGTKIDNLVQIGHNVVIGKHCFIIAFVGISGSTTIGDYAVIGGQAGLTGHLCVGNHVMIGAQSGVNHDLEDNSFVRGTPTLPYMLAHRIDALKRRLPELFRRVDNLEKTFAYLTTDTTKACFLSKDERKD